MLGPQSNYSMNTEQPDTGDDDDDDRYESTEITNFKNTVMLQFFFNLQ